MNAHPEESVTIEQTRNKIVMKLVVMLVVGWVVYFLISPYLTALVFLVFETGAKFALEIEPTVKDSRFWFLFSKTYITLYAIFFHVVLWGKAMVMIVKYLQNNYPKQFGHKKL